jgi:hypothetical protein
MSSQPHILFSYGCPPRQGVGSPIIVDRHLKRLPNDWKITVVAPKQSFSDSCVPSSWQSIPIPTRRWWWLPCRPQVSVSMQVRFGYWRNECEKTLIKERPTAILTVLHDMYSVFAAYLSKIWQVPLSVIVHDQDELFATSEAEYHWIKQRSSIVLNQATKIWPVSPELAHAYRVADSSKTSIMFPIPQGVKQKNSGWRDSFRSAPVVGYAGSIYPIQVSHFYKIAAALQKIGGTLLLVTAKDNPDVLELINSFPNIKHCAPFPQNSDAIQFLGEEASCILVFYTFDISELPWTATSFPSKLVEFSHLELPILILTPSNTALGSWASRHNWYACLNEFDENKLLQIFAELTEKQTWTKMMRQTEIVVQREFNANVIQSQFESELAMRRSMKMNQKSTF